MTLYAEVVFPLPLTQSFFYAVPQALQPRAKTGSRVMAPFGNKILMGFIVRFHRRILKTGIKLKEVREVVDESPVFSADFLSFTQHLGEYYLSSWGQFLEASLPPSLVPKARTTISLSEKGREMLQGGELPDEEKKLAMILAGKSYSLVFINRKCRPKNLSSLLARMEKRGLVCIRKEAKKTRPKKEAQVTREEVQLEFEFSLDDCTRHAAETIQEKIQEAEFTPFYLYGAQSRRQSVYFLIIQKALAQSKKVLFLTPEISLSEPLKEKFENKLGENVAFIHSQLSQGRRELEWRKIKYGQSAVVVGLRSALFAPLKNLGLLIVDEEQDESYFQSESPSYDARQGAWLRASVEKAILVYGSEAPTVEAFYRAQKTGYLLDLEDSKGQREARKVFIVDEKKERSWISQRLKEGIKERLAVGKRTVIFLNRRGYASFLLCPRCGYIPKCNRCDISLAYHKREEKLICHYCGYSLPRWTACPKCGSKVVEPRGAGVEALEEELKRIFPRARIACFASDRVRGKQAREMIFQGFERHKVDILIGTELLAHQTALPPVSLVGILNPEATLAFSDFRASQRTFQSMQRMMRFIEDDPQAEAVIQTVLPDHFSIREAARHDYLSFFSQEIEFRRLMNYPPFSHMAEIIFFGENLRNLAQKVRDILDAVRSSFPDVEILGPALASVSRLRGENRIQVILKSQKRKRLDNMLGEVLKPAKMKRSVFRYD